MKSITLLPALAAVAMLAARTQAGDYDYCEVLRQSLLFYQAQRSGYLRDMASPELDWHRNSGLDDRGPNGEDLVGGYYDAGDHMKFGLPFCYSLTALSYGIITFKNGYQKCGQLEEARRAIRWGTDWLMKAHDRPHRLCGQVGIGDMDHSYWGLPSCMTMERPVFYIDAINPGSDLAGEAAAAFASAYLVFKDTDTDYASELLLRAQELWNFADNYRGRYSDSITDAANYYSSSGYEDELTWGAAWLAYAGQSPYLAVAERYYVDYGMQWKSGPLGWDVKSSGVDAVLAEISSNSKYQESLVSYCDYIQNSVPRTPKGLIFLGRWGSLPNAANAVIVCAQAARLGINADRYTQLIKGQIDYMLGDSGRSYVVGFGHNYPKYAYHRGSACPADPCDAGTCGWPTFNNGAPNANILWGALVGGPDENDNYVDSGSNVVQNGVALDYNANFQTLVAFLAERL